MTAIEGNERRWDPPGPGPWESEGAHFGRPFPRFGRDAVVRGFKAGFSAGAARFGLLLSHFEIAFVNDFWYQQPAAFGAPKGAKGPPPAPVLWLLTRLHPGLRSRIKTSREAFEGRYWREDLKQWDEKDKPAAVKKHAALLAIEPKALDDKALLAHLVDCEKHIEDMIYLHHRYTIPCCVPVGDLLAHVSDWTDLPPGEILDLLRGSTPASLGFSAAELEALVTALGADATARAMLEGKDPAEEKIERLKNASGAVGEASKKFFEVVWHRAVSYDVGDKSTGEMPDMLVASIRAALAGGGKAKEDKATNAAALREKIPAEHREKFDELLGEARLINRLRDERGLYADCLAIGITRRAALEAGRRLKEKGKLAAADDAVHLDRAEIGALLGGGSKPSLGEIAARIDWRNTKTVADIPQFIGGEPSGPPDPSILPPAARRAARAIDAVLSNLFKSSEKTSTETIVRGISVNEGTYEGIARVVSQASEFSRIQAGDVLIAPSTAPYFNVVLPLLGAIVTDRGGQLCHAAIVAREFGIPGVVGTKEATKLIPDGARVIVDGTKGEIRVLSRPS